MERGGGRTRIGADKLVEVGTAIRLGGRIVEELVARLEADPVDELRVANIGQRSWRSLSAGQVPDRWLVLTKQERDGLVEPPQPPPDGTLEPGHARFTPRNTVIGYVVEHAD